MEIWSCINDSLVLKSARFNMNFLFIKQTCCLKKMIYNNPFVDSATQPGYVASSTHTAGWACLLLGNVTTSGPKS